jgi:DNA-binding GntR family transcriptional regulator
MAMRSRDEGKTQPVSVFSGRHDRRKVTDWVYEELKSAIVDLRLAPGDPLREATLAEQLGVSKTPIREALTRLEQEGLVETTSFKGAMVTGYSRQDLIEIYELRELLENAAARAAAESMPDADRDRLRRICRESRKLKKGNDAAGLAALISEFPGRIEASVDEHEKILEAIAARDPELAERQMSQHIRSVRDDQLRALGEAPAQP